MLNELVKQQLQYNEKERMLFIPNEIYNDLHKNVNKRHHISFAFSYYYLITWLYRYTKYGYIRIDNKIIKWILGYNPTYPEIDYIFKKNGLLDQMEYTITVKDFPVSWSFDDEFLEFTMLSDMDEHTQKIIKENLSRKYTVKFPVKAFHRYTEDEEMKKEYVNGYEDGTFYEFDNTHIVPFDVFLFCISKQEVGLTGFYLWSYLKCQNQLYNDGYDISVDDLSIETHIPRSTLCNYLSSLRSYKMIDVLHNQKFFCLAINENERKANTYVVNNYDKFVNEPIEYEKMGVVKVKEYLKTLKENKINLIEN
jgi:hypothetical protein